MGKIKLNLVSGAVLEKPLINAFKASNNEYVVLDNEINGSMGLPIILVCKLENSKLIKITDQNEWQVVKEYLKNIIAGNQIEFIQIPSEITADDIYYTQLTLPVPSFDALKKAYTLDVATTTELPTTQEPLVSNIEPVVGPTLEIPKSDDPVINPINTASVNEPVVPTNPEPEVTPSFELKLPQENEMTNVVTPSMDSVNVVNMNEPVVPNVPSNPEPEITPTQVIEPNFGLTPPVVEPISIQNVPNDINNNVNNDLFAEQKEAFMLACENMFDALVQKFKKELENKES